MYPVWDRDAIDVRANDVTTAQRVELARTYLLEVATSE